MQQIILKLKKLLIILLIAQLNMQQDRQILHIKPLGFDKKGRLIGLPFLFFIWPNEII